MTEVLLVTVNGTGVPDPFGPGFSGDIGRQVANPFWGAVQEFWGAGSNPFQNVTWQPIGYPAAITNMGKSEQVGRAEAVRQIQARPPGTKAILSGYSQGAMVINQVWTMDYLRSDGVLHNRIDDVLAIFNFGDPNRCPGIANGNTLAGIPQPKTLDGQVTGGIAGPGDLTPDMTPDFLYSFALDGDLYACAPVGPTPWKKEADAGKVGTSIFNVILNTTFLDILSIAKDLGEPIAMVEEIYNGMKFAAAGMAAPHWMYGPCVPYAAGKIMELAAAA